MKRMIMGTLAVAAFATTAQAGSLSADFRVDYDSTSYNDNATAAGLLGNSKFRLQTGRVDYKGQLNEDVTFRVRLRFDKPKSTTMQSRDNVDSAVDFANIANKFSDSFTLTIGKMATGMGGFEGNTAGPEMYLTSAAYNGTAVLGGSKGSGSAMGLKGILLYATGVQAGFTLADSQQIYLQIFNEEGGLGTGFTTAASGGAAANGDDASGADLAGKPAYAQQNSMFGFVYRGGFMEKSLNLIASYHTEHVGNKDNKADLASVGVEYSMSGFTGQLDYIMNRFQLAGATSTPKQSLDSAVLTLKYKMDRLTPIFKASFSNEKLADGTVAGVSGDVKNKYTDLGVALEYTPKDDQMFRYHIAYNNRTMDPDSVLAANGNRSSNEIIVGTRILADFLK